MGLDTRSRDRMRRQFGVASRYQLTREDGHTGPVIDGLVQRGVLEVVYRSVYRYAGGAAPPEQLPMAAALRCRPAARISGPFVLGLHRVEGFTTEDPFVVLVPPGRRVKNVPFRVRPDADHGSGPSWGELPVAPVEVAVIDAADMGLARRRLVSAVDSARWDNRLDIGRLRQQCLARPEVAGAAEILHLIDAGAFDVESHGERELRSLLASINPPPRAQVWIAPDIRVDFLWDDVLLVIEYHGRRHHASRPARRRDDARRRRIEELGYTVMEVWREDLDDPAALVAKIIAARAELLRRLEATA